MDSFVALGCVTRSETALTPWALSSATTHLTFKVTFKERSLQLCLARLVFSVWPRVDR